MRRRRERRTVFFISLDVFLIETIFIPVMNYLLIHCKEKGCFNHSNKIQNTMGKIWNVKRNEQDRKARICKPFSSQAPTCSFTQQNTKIWRWVSHYCIERLPREFCSWLYFFLKSSLPILLSSFLLSQDLSNSKHIFIHFILQTEIIISHQEVLKTNKYILTFIHIFLHKSLYLS